VEAWSRAFFPHYLDFPFSDDHKRYFALLDDKTKRLIVVAAYRHFAKSAITDIFYGSRETLFRYIRYGEIISKSEDKAMEELMNLKRELTTNERIVDCFGELKSEEKDLKWAAGSFEIRFEDGFIVKWVAKGMKSQQRGLRVGAYRPDLIIGDDMEDPDEIDNDLIRTKRKKRFKADVLHSADARRARIILIDTIKHEDSLMCEYLEKASPKANPDWEDTPESMRWHGLLLEVCDDNYISNWPEFRTTEELKAEANDARKDGSLDLWMRERRNVVISPETQSFKTDFFHPYDEEDFQRTIGQRSLQSAVIVDPSKGLQPESGFTAIVGVSIDHAMGGLYVRDVVNQKLHPDEIYDETVNMARKLKTINIGVEDHGLHEFIRNPFEDFLRKEGFFNIIWLKPRGRAKEERIKSLIPYYRRGVIWHNPKVCGALESQLMVFPHGKYKDVADALAYFNEMFHNADVHLLGKSPLVQVAKDTVIPYDKLTPQQMAKYDRKHEPKFTGWRQAL
jgi:hypothetical protein